ncbi:MULTISPECIES: PBECR4 domain-containing protein [Pasteurellaceae]|nr:MULTISPECIES: PBECR4 domain-containing protein [Pasteurellaceae]MCQ9628664.1 PBECR4 domain-containing protein [Actinobacillus suis]MCQ9631401.1 PBECR4 domain-containing protein [Actinobacillus suis]UKH13409.1 hypothetical protein D1099_05050 [Actinobacillus pleuropneumoniae serovar 6 str. Femo]SUU63414.1 Uncharacterised protein [Actinobacillus pleuropneumoniae]
MKEQAKLGRYINLIEEAAKFFNDHFINKKVIYRTENQEITVIFKRTNFMHLCGIRYTDGAAKFFRAAISKKLDLSKMGVKDDGTTFLKLSLLQSVKFLLSAEISLADRAIYLHLHFDKALRTKKQIFALTLINDEHIFVPQSLLNLKSMNEFPHGDKVISIKSIHLQDNTEKVYFDYQYDKC